MLNLSTIKSLKESVSTLIPNIDSIENYLADSSKGFKIYGSSSNDQLGNAVSSAGDVNGDGIGDIIIGASHSSPNGLNGAGAAYIIYGSEGGVQNIESIRKYLADSFKGAKIYGSSNQDGLGSSISLAGDINGDGVTDILVGAPTRLYTTFRDSFGVVTMRDIRGSGVAYIIYGNKLGISNIDSIEDYVSDAHKGCKIYGAGKSMNIPTNPLACTGVWSLGNFLSPAGDINGDGLADVIIGAGAVIFNSGWNTKGAAYVIYGNEDGIPNIGAVDSAGSVEEYIAVASKGFRIFDSKTVSDPNTYYSHYGSYYSSASAGDINGDGLADIIIGAGGASPNGLNNAGAAYIIYGKKGGLPDLGQFLQYEIEGSQGYLTDSSKGFKVHGASSYDLLGNTVSSSGDINGDGVTDIIVGASGASPNGLSSAGAAYVIYGGKELPNINSIENYLTDSSKGFKIYGSNSGDSLGNSVSSAGDVNGDGIDDIIIGTTGAAYIIYGKKGGLSNINSIKNYLNDPYNGFSIYGLASDCFGHQVSSAGDINGDGIGDIIIGASCANPNGLSRAGAAYVVYGVSSTSTKYNTGTTLSSETKVAVLTIGVLLGVAISGWLLWKYCYQGKFCPVNHITAAATVPSAPPEEVQLMSSGAAAIEAKGMGEYNELWSPPSYNEAIIEGDIHNHGLAE